MNVGQQIVREKNTCHPSLPSATEAEALSSFSWDILLFVCAVMMEEGRDYSPSNVENPWRESL